MGAMLPLGHGATCPRGPQHSPRSTAKPSWHSAAMLGRQRASKTAWGPPGASMGITWGATALPGCPHCPLTHHGGTQRGGVVVCHLRGSAIGPQKPGCLHQGRTGVCTQQQPPWAPSTLPTPHSQGSLAPRQHRGAAGAPRGSPCAAGPCPLQGGCTVRVFQVTPGTVGVSSTGTQTRGNSWPAGGSTATTWAQAMDATGAVL